MKPVSKVKILSIEPNPNSTKDQVTVLFKQLVDNEGGANPLVAAAQGSQQFRQNSVVVPFSFSSDMAIQYFGTTTFNGRDVEFDELPGIEKFEEVVGPVGLSVVENTTQDPNRPNQQPKCNPSTGEVLMHGGLPIFRHTSLVVGEPTYQLLKHDNTTAPTATEAGVDAFRVAAGQ